MEIIAHRGYWKQAEEKNTMVAFRRAWENGFGVETDLRDYQKNIVISHDMPNSQELAFNEFLFEYNKYKSGLLALNIKSDGLQAKIYEELECASIKDYFVFDMSVPDAIGYIDKKMTIATRISEFEKCIYFEECSTYIWVDCFVNEWVKEKDLLQYRKLGLKPVLVSPELHARPYEKYWARLSKWSAELTGECAICTDFPIEAREYLNV